LIVANFIIKHKPPLFDPFLEGQIRHSGKLFKQTKTLKQTKKPLYFMSLEIQFCIHFCAWILCIFKKGKKFIIKKDLLYS